MNCPYCHHELQPLIVSGRHTGSFQCEHCTGTWLQYQTFSGLLLGGTSDSVTPASPGVPARPPTGGLPHIAPGPDPLPQARSVPAGGHPGPGSSRARTRRRFTPPWKKKQRTRAAEVTSDWDICTYCGRSHPGSGPTCVHCNVERMTCPVCGRFMVGVRKHGVLVDLCLSCRGLWFEKGRIEKLIERLSSGDSPRQQLAGGNGRPPSLLHQLADFLEDTEPARHGLGGRDSSVVSTLTSAFGAGLTGSKRLLYDVLVLLGDLQSPPGKPDSTGNGRPGPK